MNLSDYRSLTSSLNWRSAKSTATNSLDDSWVEWLMHQGSLTRKLTDYAEGEFGLKVLSEEWNTPNNYEAKKLGLNLPIWAMIREVELSCKGTPTVYARSVIPKSVYQENKNTLATMGSKPLGHFLSRSALLQPSERDICEMQLQTIGDDRTKCYGRATLYSYNSGTILVQEFFIDPELASN